MSILNPNMKLTIQDEDYIKANSTSENYKSNHELATELEVTVSCINRFRFKHGLIYEKIKQYIKCKRCGERFQIFRIYCKFCSPECRRKFYLEEEHRLRIRDKLGEPYSKEEIQYVKEHPIFSSKEIAKQLNIKLNRVHNIRHRCNLEHIRFRWTNDNIQYLRDNYLTKTDKEIAEKLGSTEGSVKFIRYNLHLYLPSNGYGLHMFLKQNYPDIIKEYNNWRNGRYRNIRKIYHQQHKEEINLRHKKYYRKNKIMINEKHKQYREKRKQNAVC